MRYRLVNILRYRTCVLLSALLCIYLFLFSVLQIPKSHRHQLKLNREKLKPTVLPQPNGVSAVSVWDTTKNQDRILQQIHFKPTRIDNSRTRVILLDVNAAQWNVKTGKSIFVEQECLVQNCLISDSAHEHKRIDARLFGQNIFISGDTIRQRTQSEVWIFFSLESPFATPNYDAISHIFNWTATYRHDSTIVAPYEKWALHENPPLEIPKKNYAEGKTKQIAVFVSNCKSANKRLQYIQELSEYMTVDIFGRCGEFTCPRRSKECDNKLKREYKFYLSFENANCRHYITEKFFVNALQ